MAAMPGPVVLLGDSVFDNGAYVGGGPDVVAQLRARLPAGRTASLAAVDGAVVRDVAHQLGRVPDGASLLVVSAGGNDALRREGVVGTPVRSVGEALLQLGGEVEAFRQEYRAMLDAVTALRRPVAVCTIYEPRFAEPLRRRLAATGLALFNDVIGREAWRRGLRLIELREVCDQDADFANPIEPSVIGGEKIAAAIARLVAPPG
jgi:lysophospholipase L1-like esterase